MPSAPLQITHNGKTQSSRQWARELGIEPSTVRHRWRSGHPIDQRMPYTKTPVLTEEHKNFINKRYSSAGARGIIRRFPELANHRSSILSYASKNGLVYGDTDGWMSIVIAKDFSGATRDQIIKYMQPYGLKKFTKSGIMPLDYDKDFHHYAVNETIFGLFCQRLGEQEEYADDIVVSYSKMMDYLGYEGTLKSFRVKIQRSGIPFFYTVGKYYRFAAAWKEDLDAYREVICA